MATQDGVWEVGAVEDLEEEEVGGVSEEVPEVEGVEALGEEGVEVVLVAVGVDDALLTP